MSLKKNNSRPNCKKAEEIARMVLEMNHVVNGLSVKPNQETCHVNAIVDLTKEQVLEIVIHNKTGKILRFATI